MHPPGGIPHELDRNQAGGFFEHDGRCHGSGTPLRDQREGEGRPHIGVPGEWDLAGAGEDAHPRGMRAVIRRKHERRLRVVELGRDRLHLVPGQAARVRDDGERIAGERAIGEYVDGDVGVLPRHRDLPEAGLTSLARVSSTRPRLGDETRETWDTDGMAQPTDRRKI